ncbi:MAG: Rne/Rng family ribonuclease, partial [Gammaproteobacteria bacterium]|nr:Rne/Rng family ribonuclease [Gammaproteobacteria bacterium]
MTKKILINATQAEELRVAIVQDNILFDLDIETTHRAQKKANIYKAKVSRIEASLNAIFVDYGAERHGFLPMKELAPQYTGKDNRPNLREGDEIIIQIEKEERGNKGAAVTTIVTLAGCYMVLMPNSHRSGGVSRRIEGEDRQQLKELLSNLNIPENMSVIARTACLGRSQEELQWDLDALLKLWATILEESDKHGAPFLIYQESDVIMRSVRDYLRQDIDEILVDDRKTYERVLQYVKTLRPDFADRVHSYHNDVGIFTYHRIESQIETAFQREVKLPSGGSIVIDHTEALTSIDINSARATKAGDIEETAHQTNVEAAREIARQLKLRDLGGLIVIDFIDMENSKNQRHVEETLSEAVKGDRARIQTSKISRFGLLEMSRQRLRPSLEESSGLACPRCNGQGTIRGVDSLSLSIIRLIQEEAMRADVLEVHIQLPLSVATFLSNEKRHLIADLETQNKIRIVLIPNPNIETPHYELTKVVRSTDEVMASYHLKATPKTETYTATAAKIMHAEQPAIRELSISKAPSQSPLKRSLNNLLSKIQGVFTAEPEIKKEPIKLNIKSQNNQANRRAPEPATTSAATTQESGPQRRNNNDRRRGNNNNRNGQKRDNPNRNRPAVTAPATNENLNLAAVAVPVAPPKPIARKPVTPATVAKKSIPIVIDFSTPKAQEKADKAPVVISAKVQAILNQPSTTPHIQQIESKAVSQDKPVKLKKEEVIEKTDFSIEAARENIKKQHAQVGT